MDCFGTYFTHARTCVNVRVQTATEWTASVQTFRTPKPVITFVLKVYAMDCFGAHFTHAQTCDDVCVRSGEQWTGEALALGVQEVKNFFFGACCTSAAKMSQKWQQRRASKTHFCKQTGWEEARRGRGGEVLRPRIWCGPIVWFFFLCFCASCCFLDSPGCVRMKP